MLRNCLLGVSLVVGFASSADAQVYVRAPFVRVQVGGPGVYVRAPFVNLYVPSGPRVYYGPPPVYFETPNFVYPPPIYVPAPYAPAPRVVPAEPNFVPPAPMPVPPPVDDAAPPPAIQPARGLSLDDFAKTFKPQAGSFELMITNPLTNEPTNVRFTLPEGQPTRVIVNRREIEFHYGPRRFVRIEFDRDGAIVTSRL